jgi:hypothetical protein
MLLGFNCKFILNLSLLIIIKEVLVILFKISSWLFFGDQNVVISFIHVLASLGGSYRSFME